VEGGGGRTKTTVYETIPEPKAESWQDKMKAGLNQGLALVQVPLKSDEDDERRRRFRRVLSFFFSYCRSWVVVGCLGF